MLHLPRRTGARFVALVRADPAGYRAGFGALFLASCTGLVAGLTLGAITGTLEDLPGLLVMVPAAIGVRGSVYGALGSRLGTAIHTGTFHLSARRDTLVAQNAAASLSLSIGMSLLLAVVAKLVAVAFGVPDTISVADFVVVSFLGGLLSSSILLFFTVGIAALSVRYDWDLDNVSAPIVTSTGDVVTLPSLFLATYLAERGWVTASIATVATGLGVVVVSRAWRSRRPILRMVVRQSAPVLALTSLISIMAGLTVEKQLDGLLDYPVLLVLIPPFLGLSGSLGGVFASRVGTKLHLGVLPTDRFSLRSAPEDVLLVVSYALPVYVLLGVAAEMVGRVAGLRSPGVVDVVSVAVLAGAAATVFVIVVAYTAAFATYRLGLDPDNHGIPIVTSTLDLGGSLSLILVIVLLGLT